VSFKKLLESWRETAAAPRTVTEFSVRLPVDDAAQLQALMEMFPGRTVEQLITDLLGAALQEVATAAMRASDGVRRMGVGSGR
jgi:hypothetical protein